MISHDSVLRRLPPALDPRQALFFDGIRHTGEIACLAYSRLQATLTEIALNEHEPELSSRFYTSAFLDAWSLIDAIDRFRALWMLLPRFNIQAPPKSTEAFIEISQPIRNLRNVADHLAQRIDYVLAHNGTALGALSWVTAVDIAKGEGLICTIVPGTIKNLSTPCVNPAGRGIDLPSGLVELSAGEYTANISEALPYMEACIRELEAGLRQGLEAQEIGDQQAGADVLMKMFFTSNHK